MAACRDNTLLLAYEAAVQALPVQAACRLSVDTTQLKGMTLKLEVGMLLAM